MMRSTTDKTRNILAVGCLLLLPCLLGLPGLIPPLTADPLLWSSNLIASMPTGVIAPGRPGFADDNAGVTTEMLGHLAATDWLAGRIPWWNPLEGIGMPLAGEMQNSALFLSYVLLLALPHGVLLLKIAVEATAGVSTFLLLRRLSIGTETALAFAVAFEFCGTFAYYAHGPIMPVAFLPMLCLGFERARAAAALGRLDPALIAVALAFSIVAGFPETAFLDALWAGVFALGRLPPTPDRARFVGAAAIGVATGLLLAAPALTAFLGYLPHAYLSVHADLSRSALLQANQLLFLLPYAYGGILFNRVATGAGQEIWWHQGGYLGLLPVLLAIWSALRPGGPQRTLRVALAFALVVVTARAVGAAPFVSFFALLPGFSRIYLPMYVVPGASLATIILGALAVEHWRATGTRAGLPVALLATTLLLGLALIGGWPEIYRLLAAARYRRVAVPATLAELGLTATVTLTLYRPRTGGARRLVPACVALGAILDFCVPYVSLAHDRPLDLAPASFLRSHLGFGRFASANVAQANIGSYLGLASINSIGLPVPANWVAFLHRRIDPTMDGVTFWGDTLRGGVVEDPLDPPVPLARVRATLAGLGTRFVLLPHGADPLRDSLVSGGLDGARVPLPLPANGMVATTLVLPPLAGATVFNIGVLLGTYAGQADGILLLTACGATGACRTGRIDAAGAADNAFAEVALSAPLSVGPDGRVAVMLARTGGRRELAAWARANAPSRPIFHLSFDAGTPLRQVYTDRILDIWALPGPAPYASSIADRCAVTIRSRERIVTRCPAGGGTLIRRELVFPGWTARAGQRALPIGVADGIVQTVPLPAGVTTVTFRYAPPLIGPAFVAMLLGLVILTGGVFHAGQWTPGGWSMPRLRRRTASAVRGE